MTQSDMLPGEPHGVNAVANAIRAAFTFGEAATLAGLSGSSRAGWDCPSCSGSTTINERVDHRGGRCGACGWGFDVINLVRFAHGLTFLQALTKMQDHLSAQLKDVKTGDLFP